MSLGEEGGASARVLWERLERSCVEFAGDVEELSGATKLFLLLFVFLFWPDVISRDFGKQGACMVGCRWRRT